MQNLRKASTVTILLLGKPIYALQFCKKITERKKKEKKKKDKKIRLKIKNTVNHVTTNNNKHQTNIFCLIEIAKLSAQISGLVLPAYFSQTSGFGCRYCTRQRCSVSQASNKQAAAHQQRAATGMQ